MGVTGLRAAGVKSSTSCRRDTDLMETVILGETLYRVFDGGIPSDEFGIGTSFKWTIRS